MTWTQAYSLSVTAKMGTFPKSGKDHNNPFQGGSGKVSWDDDLSWFAASVDLLDQLRCRLTTGFGVAGIDGDNFRVQEFHQRRTAHACQLDALIALLL